MSGYPVSIRRDGSSPLFDGDVEWVATHDDTGKVLRFGTNTLTGDWWFNTPAGPLRSIDETRAAIQLMAAAVDFANIHKVLP